MPGGCQSVMEFLDVVQNTSILCSVLGSTWRIKTYQNHIMLSTARLSMAQSVNKSEIIKLYSNSFTSNLSLAEQICRILKENILRQFHKESWSSLGKMMFIWVFFCFLSSFVQIESHLVFKMRLVEKKDEGITSVGCTLIVNTKNRTDYSFRIIILVFMYCIILHILKNDLDWSSFVPMVLLSELQ